MYICLILCNIESKEESKKLVVLITGVTQGEQCCALCMRIIETTRDRIVGANEKSSLCIIREERISKE